MTISETAPPLPPDLGGRTDYSLGGDWNLVSPPFSLGLRREDVWRVAVGLGWPSTTETAAKVAELEARITALEEGLEAHVLVVTSMSREEARKALLAYFLANPRSFPSDAALELRLDPEVARDLSAELVNEGKLATER